MGIGARLRAYAGQWTLIGLLATAVVFVAAAAGPVTREIEDRALRELVAGATVGQRDIVVDQLARHGSSGAALHDQVSALMAPPLADLAADSWGIQRSTIEQPAATTLAGDGVAAEPAGMLPVATLHHQADLTDEITMVEGAPPRVLPEGDVVEVMAAVAVADALGLRVGQTYRLVPGAPLLPSPAARREGAAVVLTGVFEARDPAAPVWDFDPRLLAPVTRGWPLPDRSPTQVQQATLVSDQQAVDLLYRVGLNRMASPELVARFRIDEQRLDAGQVAELRAAVAALHSNPSLPADVRIRTGLVDLLDEFERDAAAARAVIAVVSAGLAGAGVGLILLAAALTVDRRRAEVSLLRARGGSTRRVAGRFLAEAGLVVAPAAAAGWLLHLPIAGRADPGQVLGIGPAPLAVAAVVLLVVPVAVLVDQRRRSVPRRFRSAPARATAELLVILLAGLGVLLLHRRGLSSAGTDPYLSAVPVLIGLAAGLLALRLYPWPLRALGAAAARRPGAVGFLGLARAGRAAPAAGLPLLVVVLAVAVGGFAGTVHGSVTAARDRAAVQAVGADARVRSESLGPATVSAVSGVSGVEVVAAAHRDGVVRSGGRVIQGVPVVAVDAPAYQRVLAALGGSVRLPDPIVSASPGVSPVPALAAGSTAGLADLTVEIGEVELPVAVVGDVADLPGPDRNGSWVLIPRQVLPELPPVDELLIAGPVDPDDLRAAAGGAEVTTRAEHRAALADSGFNRGLTISLVAGTVGAAMAGLLAVGLALVVQAAARGRALSLLRTMGLSARQARGLLLVELLPAAALAVAAGAAAGVGMPLLLAPALGLTEFTGGAPIPPGLDLGTVAGFAGLLGAFVAGAILVETAANRRATRDLGRSWPLQRP